MKKVIQRSLVVLLLVSLVFPMLPQAATTSPLSPQQMSSINGGLAASDCGALASAAEAFCYMVGGGALTCSALYAGTYVGCILAKILL